MISSARTGYCLPLSDINRRFDQAGLPVEMLLVPPSACRKHLFVLLQMLDFYGLRGLNKWMQLVYEACFFVFFFLAAWLGLTYLRYQKR